MTDSIHAWPAVYESLSWSTAVSVPTEASPGETAFFNTALESLDAVMLFTKFSHMAFIEIYKGEVSEVQLVSFKTLVLLEGKSWYVQIKLWYDQKWFGHEIKMQILALKVGLKKNS